VGIAVAPTLLGYCKIRASRPKTVNEMLHAAPDSADDPEASQSNLTAAPGIDPNRESADVFQAPGPRHCWARCTGRVQKQ